VKAANANYYVANMPGAYARTATQVLTNVTYRYLETLANYGIDEACQKNPALVGGINIKDGEITHKAVAGAHGIPIAEDKIA
jgi:alanine dehydrogenase